MVVDEPQVRKGQRICEVEGCERKHHSNGYCRRHSMRVYMGMPKEKVDVVGKLKNGTEKLGEDWVILIRLSSNSIEEWRAYLEETHGMPLHRNAVYQARAGKTYRELPMDRDELIEECQRRGLDVPE